MMNRERFRTWFSEEAVVRGRLSSVGALARGWAIDSSRVLGLPDAAAMASDLLWELTANTSATCVVGIERSGVVLSRGVAAASVRDGRALKGGLVSVPGGLHDPGPGGAKIGPGDRAIVVDDTIDSGWTARRAIRSLEAIDLEVAVLACLVTYARARPLLLRSWSGQVLSLYRLADLGLSRFGAV